VGTAVSRAGTATHCSTLQHTAPHCNTLQRTETRCGKLRHTATHCNTLQRTSEPQCEHGYLESGHCNTLPHTAPHCNISQHTETRCGTARHTVTHCDTLQRNSKPQCVHGHLASGHCNTLQHTATHCGTLRHGDTQRFTATHCNAPRSRRVCTAIPWVRGGGRLASCTVFASMLMCGGGVLELACKVVVVCAFWWCSVSNTRTRPRRHVVSSCSEDLYTYTIQVVRSSIKPSLHVICHLFQNEILTHFVH